MNKTIWTESILSEKVKLFKSGERDFSPQELNDIKIDLLRYKDCLTSTQFFESKIKMSNHGVCEMSVNVSMH